MLKLLFTILFSVSSIWINAIAENIEVNQDESIGSARIYYQKGAINNFSVEEILNYRSLSGYNIGDFAFGGVVIWLTKDRKHGLVVAISDLVLSQQNELMWGPKTITTGAVYNTPLPFSTPNTPYAQYYGGYKNQQIVESISAWQSQFPAFKAAEDYSVTVNGETFGDWFIPSLRELSLIYRKRNIINKVAVSKGGDILRNYIRYWSSVEVSEDGAYGINFSTGQKSGFLKDNVFGVRCVRAF